MEKNSNFSIWVLVGGLALIAMLSVYNHFQTFGRGQNALPPQQTTTNPMGKAAPDFTLNDLAGQTIRLSDLKGKIVVLNFWASWCPPCKAEMPDLEQIGQEFRSQPDLVFLAVNVTDGIREKETDARNYITINHFSMHVLLDRKGQVADAYGITGIPATFVIDRQGNIYQTIKGSTTRAVILNYVDEIK